MTVSLVLGILTGVISEANDSLKWLEFIGRGLFVIGLTLIPTLFGNMAYVLWKNKQGKKIVIQTVIFTFILVMIVTPFIIMLCS